MIITEDRNSNVEEKKRRGEMVQREKMSKIEGNMKVDFMYKWME